MQEPKHEPPQIFDRIFKRLMHLSKPALIQFINGLFMTDYPLDSAVEYLATEHITDHLQQRITDIHLLIAQREKYLIEVQMSDDEEMALRIFNYEYLQAVKTKVKAHHIIKLKFSRCMVIYLEPTSATPDELIVESTFPDQSVHRFTVPTFKFLEHSIAELEGRNMSILLPFYLLKLRKRVKGAGSGEGRRALSAEMRGIVGEIMQAIERSEQRGQMSKGDMRVVINLMGKLYNDLYKPYPEFKETNEMVEEMMVLEVDEAEARGEAKGKHEGKVQVARNMIRKGWAKEEIAETTELDLATVESLYRSSLI